MDATTTLTNGGIGMLEEVTQCAPAFTEAWGRLAYIRAWLHFYQPFTERATSAARVNEEAGRAMEADPHNFDALAGQLFVIPAFGNLWRATKSWSRPNKRRDGVMVDALIIAYAEHNGSFTAAYKNLVGWASRIDGKVFQDKPTLMLATCPWRIRNSNRYWQLK